MKRIYTLLCAALLCTAFGAPAQVLDIKHLETVREQLDRPFYARAYAALTARATIPPETKSTFR